MTRFRISATGRAPAPAALFALAIMAAVGHQASAQTLEPAKRGQAVAQKWCSGCHVVAEGQRREATDAVPPFAELANDPKLSETRLRGILLRPHGKMPTGVLTRDDIGDLLAYFASLKAKKKP